jgi:hypothetical protein
VEIVVDEVVAGEMAGTQSRRRPHPMSRGERMPAEMAVPEAAVDGAGKAEVKGAEVEAMAATPRLRIRSDGDGQHRREHGRKYHGTYSNSTMRHGSLLEPPVHAGT